MSTPKRELVEQAIELERARRVAKKTVDAEEAPPREPLQALTIRELYALPAVDYLIDLLIPERALGEFVGDSETLKSFVAIHMGMAIATDTERDFFGQAIVKHGPVLYIAAEGGGAFQYRIRAFAQEHGIDIDATPFRVITAPINLRDASFQQELRGIIACMKPVLIFVDTLHRVTPGAEENSSRDLGEVVAFSAVVQMESGAAVFYLHHPPKSDPTGRGRGSGSLFNAADTELSSVIEGKEDAKGVKIITLSVKKQKDDAKVSLSLRNRIVTVLNELGFPLAHTSGRPITSCVLEEVGAEEVNTVRREVQKQSALAAKVLAFVQQHPGHTLAEIRTSVEANKTKVQEVLDVLVNERRVGIKDVLHKRAWRKEYHLAPVPKEEEEPCGAEM